MRIRFLVGPPVAGALYDRFGFHGPFIFGIIVTAVDLIGRFLIIERKHAIRWGIDPAAPVPRRADPEGDAVEVTVEAKCVSGEHATTPVASSDPGDTKKAECPPIVKTEAPAVAMDAGDPPSESYRATANDAASAAQVRISLWAVLVKLVRSVRADAVFLCTLFYGYVNLYSPVARSHMTAAQVDHRE